MKIDFFSEFGNQRELLRIIDMCELFKWGGAKQIKKSLITDERMDSIVSKFSTGTTKSGGVAKSYTLLDVPATLRGLEDLIKSLNMSDLDYIVKIKNYKDIMGYLGYTTGKDEDRRRLFVTKVEPIITNGATWAHRILTKSIGSGVEGRFTCRARVFDKNPIAENDIIYCRKFVKEKQYYVLTEYEKII